MWVLTLTQILRWFGNDRSTKLSSGMARLKTFDEETVLDRAMDLFWRQGYEGTGVQDLVDELGISRSSLYATFGGKEQLFLRSFERYCSREAGPRHALLTGPGSPLAGIRALLLGLADAPSEYPDRRGCLVVNSAMERIPGDAGTTAAVTGQLARLEEALHATLRRAQAEGEVDPAADARAQARFLVAIVQGMRVVGKATADRRALLDTVDVAVAALGAPVR